MWIRRNSAFKSIIPPALFAKAQKLLVELERGREASDKELRARLRALRRRKGRLSLQLMMMAKDVPHFTVYAKRFGSLTNAYRLAGFKPEAAVLLQEIASEIDRTISSVVEDIQADLERHGSSVTLVRELHLLVINRNLTVAVVTARSVGEGSLKPRRGKLRRAKMQAFRLDPDRQNGWRERQNSGLLPIAYRKPATHQR
jgi:hypothetical protein